MSTTDNTITSAMKTKRALQLLLLTGICSASSKRIERELKKGAFCSQPSDPRTENLQHCKFDETWKTLTQDIDVTWQQREFTSECGPTCRPSCVTLMLDLDKLDYDKDLKCEVDELCQCEFSKCSECDSEKETTLFEDHPKCYLEQADCLGATVYDDTAAVVELTLNDPSLPPLEHCTSIPDEDLYCRFQDWKMVGPMEINCDPQKEPCFDKERRIFFEYCHIAEEDPSCRECTGDRCAKECPKKIEPFPPGWTTFVVSASIPYPLGQNARCDRSLDWEEEAGAACFLERVEMYYPPENEDCSDVGCPHCHDCPLLSLGDTFGPLEVVGFGHGIQTPCSACDKKTSKNCGVDTLSCDSLLQCENAVDCATGESLGLAPFSENECSFCDNPDFGSQEVTDEEADFGEQEIKCDGKFWQSWLPSCNEDEPEEVDKEEEEPDDSDTGTEVNGENDSSGIDQQPADNSTENDGGDSTEKPTEEQEATKDGKTPNNSSPSGQSDNPRDEKVFSGATSSYATESQGSDFPVPAAAAPIAFAILVVFVMAVWRRQLNRQVEVQPEKSRDRDMDIDPDDNSVVASNSRTPVLLDKVFDEEGEDDEAEITDPSENSCDGLEEFHSAMVMQSESREFETLYFTGKTSGV